ncbi:Conserved_hypothetical protein [Hexamita inflata]|uniref:Transmembrane protein n=1 Tax=Hexamita inflata TaxID=28002 RepID=A0AA86Q3D0_9EUKA|nr:Conserved hypothetical protein [Hexamita inflata]
MLIIQTVCCQVLNKQAINVSNCYTKQSKLTLDKIQNLFTLEIFPTNNKNCAVFTGDVQINLTVGYLSISDQLVSVAQDFVYNQIQIISFWIPYDYDITNYNDENFAIATLFVVNYQTIIPVLIFEALKSDFIHSFDLLLLSIKETLTSAVKTISFAMCPGYTSASLLQDVNSEILDVVLVVDRFQFKVDKARFIDSYQWWSCFIQFIQIPEQQIQEILGVSFLYAKLVIVTKQNTRKVVMHFNVNINASSMQFVFKDQYIYLYQKYNNEIGFNVYYNYDLAQFEKVRQQIDMLVYDFVEYQLTAQNTNSITKFVQNHSISLTMPRFFETTKQINFSCTNMIGAQKKTCLQIYDINMNEVYSTQKYNLDIIFKFQNKIVLAMKCKIPTTSIRYTCWSYGVAVITNSGVQIKLTSTHKCDGYEKYYDYSNVSTTLTYTNKQFYQTDQFQRWVQIPLASNFNQFNYSCGELNCSVINANSTFVFQYLVDVFIEMYTIDKVIDLRVKYDGLRLTVIVLAVILLVLVINMFCDKAKYSQQVIIDYQKIKPKKKPTIDDLLQVQLKLKLHKKLQ